MLKFDQEAQPPKKEVSKNADRENSQVDTVIKLFDEFGTKELEALEDAVDYTEYVVDDRDNSLINDNRRQNIIMILRKFIIRVKSI